MHRNKKKKCQSYITDKFNRLDFSEDESKITAKLKDWDEYIQSLKNKLNAKVNS